MAKKLTEKQKFDRWLERQKKSIPDFKYDVRVNMKDVLDHFGAKTVHLQNQFRMPDGSTITAPGHQTIDWGEKPKPSDDEITEYIFGELNKTNQTISSHAKKVKESQINEPD